MKIKYVKDMFYGLDHYGKQGSKMYSEVFYFGEDGSIEDYSFELDGYGKTQEKIRYVEIIPNIKLIYQKALSLIDSPRNLASIKEEEAHILVYQIFEC